MQIADANIVLRYVLDDHPQFSPQAAEILENNEVRVPFEVVCEVVYVLQKVYTVPKEEIRAKIKSLLDTHLINPEKPVILQLALDMFCERNLDFVDAILCAYSTIEGVEVFTFDMKLQKCLDMKGTHS